jgi:hypothetical protein
MRAAIDWLNSHEGVLWSRERHWQSLFALKLFSFKDHDYVSSADIQYDRKCDRWQSWGRVDKLGRYRRPSRHLLRRGRVYNNYYTGHLADNYRETYWYDEEGNSVTCAMCDTSEDIVSVQGYFSRVCLPCARQLCYNFWLLWRESNEAH